MNEHSKSRAECPDSVIRAGAKLVSWRRRAEKLAAEMDAGMPDVLTAIKHVCDHHGAKYTQAGAAIVSLRAAQAAPGHIASAHDGLRLVLGECGIEEPTDQQIRDCMKDDGEPDPGTESIR